jgi:hypothetical protein
MPAAEIRSYADLIRALRERKERLDVSFNLLEDISGLQSGHISKLLSPRASKRLGELSLDCLLAALGVKLVVQVDPVAMARVRSRLTPRYRAGRERHAVCHIRQPAAPSAA